MTKKYEVEEIAEIIKALGLVQKHDPASTTLTAQTLHGPNLGGGSSSQYGLFTGAGVRPGMFSTLTRPNSLMRLVSIEQSRYTNELLEVMTGVTAGKGSAATDWCGDAPRAGDGKVARQTYTFGNFRLKTSLQALPLTGQLKDRADVPRDILNAGEQERNPFIPSVMYQLNDTQSQLQWELFRMGIQAERDTERVIVTGTSGASSATAPSWWSQFVGLDGQIKTGYTDSVTSVAAPALDSIVETFGTTIGNTIAGGDGRNIVQVMTDIFYAARDRATSMQMDGTQWAWVMRKENFRALTDQWVCNYATNRCNDGSAGNPLNRDVTEQNNMRNDMMNGQFLWVDGIQVPVVFSEGIPFTASTNDVFESDIYLVPYMWMGVPLLRFEYFPMNNQYLTEFANGFANGAANVAELNNGMYLVADKSTGFCLEWHFAMRGRLILETPFLAGRLDNVTYTYRAQTRTSYPGASLYANGGATYRS